MYEKLSEHITSKLQPSRKSVVDCNLAYIYLSTILVVHYLSRPVSILCYFIGYFYSTTSQGEFMYFLFHYRPTFD